MTAARKRKPESVTFTAYGPPVPKARARRGKGGHWHTPKQTAEYEKLVAWHALARRRLIESWPLDGSYRIECAIYFPDERRRDSDNVLKSVLDACNGVLWNDDAQVVETATMKFVSKYDPRIDVRVYVLESP